MDQGENLLLVIIVVVWALPLLAAVYMILREIVRYRREVRQEKLR